ncbi:hypothetical protein N836_10350 [Leptolyngbya sp. Heron Island J]|uniref:hypothetical protein n=1 Tax=Leptolyngbya sp. Heron Island J TaxID=1385935 RepID=UPI0003B9B551|nr:hypothetical protein [Leptolyngbya sp. Heron Island J]ESA35921.1 hypothetical protein N836_10350 [Leptolyngbya sp. Heron Island J]
MTTEYTIYLVNESASSQTFWCFLKRPEELASDPQVYANSSTNLTVGSFQPGINTFTIPVQYQVGAGASNKAVGLDIKVNSGVSNDADLGDTWEADYVTVPPKQGPTMQKLSSDPSKKSIAIASNAFDRGKNEGNQWFSNMSFGIETSQGFIGMTWSPSPQQTRTLTPKLKFYVAIGSYGNNTLADWTTVSNNAAEISVPGSFKYNETTVTYTSTGAWKVEPGKPSAMILTEGNVMNTLIQSHENMSKAHADLIAWAQHSSDNLALPATSDLALLGSSKQTDKIVKVNWSNAELDYSDNANVIITGTLTVATALTAAFAYFILSGVRFEINGDATGRTSFSFTYNGERSAQAIRDLVVAGANIALGGNQNALTGANGSRSNKALQQV